MTIIIIRSVFEEDGKLYPQAIFMTLCMKYNMKGLMLVKQVHQRNVVFVTIGILKILVLSMNRIFAIVVII